MATNNLVISGCVYKYTNKCNGKVYIGETIDLNRRQRSHLTCKGFSYFHQAIEKEGIDIFDFEVLFQHEGLDKNEVKCKVVELEEFYINEYQAFHEEKGYNYCRGANYGSNGIYWKLTIFDNQISNILKDIARHPIREDWEQLTYWQEERLPILIQEREELRIILGARY